MLRCFSSSKGGTPATVTTQHVAVAETGGIGAATTYASEHSHFDLYRKLTSQSLNELALPADKKLIEALESKGRRSKISDIRRTFTWNAE